MLSDGQSCNLGLQKTYAIQRHKFEMKDKTKQKKRKMERVGTGDGMME